ncbi:ribosomal large subunit pseudouridine synthase B [Candidatus Saccharibacteria bacterium 49-20]|nr:MAG: ribosomal large subunit pseudouridine synthase B [Candidatus Saccharibacteria bacterium 49-20]
MSERLNKYLAFHLGLSRREADDLISKGKVLIDNMPIALGARVEEGQTVTVSGKPVAQKENYSYIALNKPRGYVSSRKQQGENPTLYSLLPKEYHALKPVGRLDKDSSGLLLLTDDGDFAFQMTHPKFYKVKTYEVSLSTPLEPLHQQMISDFGIQLEDGPSKLSLERKDESRKNWTVTMHEGRNRQIRRTFAALGYEVTILHRTSFGNYALNELESGAFQSVKRID